MPWRKPPIGARTRPDPQTQSDGDFAGRRRKDQLACKPGSVWLRLTPERGSHSSGTGLAPGLVQPTRMTGPETG